MYDLQRTHAWTAEKTTEPLVVMRALSPILHAAGQSRWYLRTDGYVLKSQTTHIQKVTDLEHSARRVPDMMKSIVLEYKTPFSLSDIWQRPDCQFILTVRGLPSYEYEEQTSVEVGLTMKGPDTDEVAGIMDRVKTQIESEFVRQESEDWHAEPPPMNFPASSPFRRLVNHQWFVAIVGGLLVTLLWLALGAGCTYLKTRVDTPAPAEKTTSTTAVPQPQAPLPAPEK